MVYRLTRQAAEDVRSIYREGRRIFGKEQADRYHAYLQSVFELLSDNPKLARERGEIEPPVRMHPCGSHLIVYNQHDEGGVLIIRIRHHRENWQ
ncbi:type II toxin-antitoxin system RelE/ParE family toxin [Rhizobium sp. RAF56]|uniref:type II toxin-antitoxin system RelE/ParE family toxin n=1 Tax=Rhizobium sp. RAF56 TaxID=3233062 RepID=UPI003F9684D6